ncbi:tripartite tricarboxylate transporter substrate binding protein [Variovorax sp. J31P179]|uniref:Bug family tripartite tricarboxylate transporter substrate binding protein n=1 Tax=Variovorax sp. J31P179 TaxID=3053508 RepID=UPI00257598D2|nr:tripartite tricarboxylate transporter substrate binding protein [Variovorax sp. J31P179]MDM0085380.1 tripartite tricarboxylate transporter substrate binding protein [Variovorax sp. J31P179]
MLRRTFLSSSMALAVAPAMAQSGVYPDRIIKMINPFPSGGTTEILARILAESLYAELGQRMIVDTKAGAGGNIGLEATARAPADGYTLAMYPISSTMATSVYKDLRFDPVKDLAAVALVGKMPALLVVHPDRPIHSVAELIAYAKAKPGKLSYASAGIGTSPHLYMELLKHETGIDLLHVPYKGAGPAIVDQIAGQVDISFQTATAVVEHVRQKQMRALGTSTMEVFKPLPQVPAVAKTVPGFDVSTWFGVVAPVGVPKPIIDKLNAAIMKALAQPAIKARWEELGITIAPNSADEFGAFIRSEAERWASVAKLAGVRPE